MEEHQKHLEKETLRQQEELQERERQRALQAARDRDLADKNYEMEMHLKAEQDKCEEREREKKEKVLRLSKEKERKDQEVKEEQRRKEQEALQRSNFLRETKQMREDAERRRRARIRELLQERQKKSTSTAYPSIPAALVSPTRRPSTSNTVPPSLSTTHASVHFPTSLAIFYRFAALCAAMSILQLVLPGLETTSWTGLVESSVLLAGVLATFDPLLTQCGSEFCVEASKLVSRNSAVQNILGNGNGLSLVHSL